VNDIVSKTKQKNSIRPSKAACVRGFSLIEALVVISVMVVLTSILVLYSRKGEQHIIFFKQEALLSSALLRAKGFALETFQPTLQPGLNPTSERVCGWGVYFAKGNRQEFIVFRDIAQGAGVSDCASANRRFSPNETFEIFKLDSALEFKCLNIVATGGVCPNNGGIPAINVVFVPPDPTVEFRPNAGGAEAVIVLGFVDSTQTRTTTIRINKSGQVSVN